MISPKTSIPKPGHGTVIVLTCALAVFKTADACTIPSENPRKATRSSKRYLAGAKNELAGLAVWRPPIGFGPGFFAREHGRGGRQTFLRYETLQSCEPMVIVVRAIIGLTAIGGGFEFIREGCRPLFPSEMPFGRQPDREREGLCLPRLGKDRSALIARQTG